MHNYYNLEALLETTFGFYRKGRKRTVMPSLLKYHPPHPERYTCICTVYLHTCAAVHVSAVFQLKDIAVITGAVCPTLLFQEIQAVDLENTESSCVISELSTSVDTSSKEGLNNVSMYPIYCIAAIFRRAKFSQ